MGDIAVGVVGIGGRMGRMIAIQLLDTKGVCLSGGTLRPGSAGIGGSLSDLLGRVDAAGFADADPGPLFARSDSVIDFTLPEALPAHLGAARETGTPFVVGITGLSKAQEAELEAASVDIPIVFAPNMSPGVTLLTDLVEKVARVLGEDYDIEIVEMHHRNKIDAPSGTAVALGKAAALGRGVDFDSHAVLSREGHTGVRERGAIGFATLRGGDVVGEHNVIFAGPSERFEIGHRAASRALFANGAVLAAKWVVGRPPGLYSMRDVLGLTG